MPTFELMALVIAAFAVCGAMLVFSLWCSGNSAWRQKRIAERKVTSGHKSENCYSNCMAVASIDTILDNLNDYADYEERGDVSRCKNYITAARRFLGLPSNQSSRSNSMGYTPEMIRSELQYAQAWLRTNGTASNTQSSKVRFFDVSEGHR